MTTEKGEVGRILSSIYPDRSDDLNDNGFDSLLNDLSPLFSLSTLLNLPQVYHNRQGRAIMIRGKVIEGTKEHTAGYAYYSHEEEFFTMAGQLSDDEQSPGDLVDVVGKQEIESVYPTKTWIHGDHLSVTSFFKGLSPGKTGLSKGCHYVNRMGFVVGIIDKDDNDVFTGDDHSFYNELGQLLTEHKSPFNLPSMYDLVYVIKNWSLFSNADWSHVKISRHDDPANFVPEVFDPTKSEKDKKEKKFFDGLIDLHALAKELNIPFGFHLNVPDGTTVG